MKYRSVLFALILLSTLLAASCQGERGAAPVSQTGGLVARAVFAGGSSPAASTRYTHLPATVVTMRAIVSADDMDPLQEDFDAAADQGVIEDVPAGENRTLTLQAINNVGLIAFEGQATAITIVPGIVNVIEDPVVLNALLIPGVSISETSGGSQVSESSGTDTVGVVLDKQPNGTVVVTATSPDPGEAVLSDSDEAALAQISLSFDTNNWNVEQTVTITGVNDAAIDGPQVFDLAIAVDTANTADTTGYSVLLPRAVSLTVLDDEVPVLLIAESGSSTVMSENGGTDTLTIVLSTQPDGNVVITATSADTGEAVLNDADETATSPVTLTFTPANFASAQAITVEGVDENLDDGDKTVNLAIAIDGATADTTGYAALAVQNLAITVQDDDTLGVTLTESGGSTFVLEESGTDTFTVELATVPDGDVVINVASPDIGEARVSDADDELVPAAAITLTFTPANWNVPQTVTVTGINEFFKDGHQIINLNVSVNAGATADTTGYDALPDQTLPATVLDFDTADIVVFQSGGASAFSENGGTDTFQVSLSGLPDGNVVIQIFSLDTSELVLSDADEFSTSPVTLTFTIANFDTPQTVTMEGVDDALVDGDQPVSVKVQVNIGATTDTTGYALVPVPDLPATVQDDDVPVLSISESGGSTTLSENGGTDGISIVLGTQPDGDVAVTVSSSDTGEAVLSDLDETATSPVNLLFTTANWLIPQSVTVVGVDDPIADGDQGTVLSVAINAGATFDTTGYAALPTQNLSATVQDDESLAVTIVESGGTTVLSENGGTDTFTVVLSSEPIGNVVVTVTSAETAEALLSDSDETNAGQVTLTFTAADWNAPQTVTASGVDENIADGNQTFNLAVAVDPASTDTTGYLTLPAQNVSATVQDDEVSGLTIIESGGSTILSESGGSDGITVQLATEPNGTVIITVSSTDINEALLSGGGLTDVSDVVLTFDAGDWDTPQPITLTGQPELNDDGDQVFNIQFARTGGTDTTDLVSMPVQTIPVTVQDDDTAGVTITVTGGNTTLAELGGSDTFDLVLTSEPLGVVDLTVTSPDTGEAVLTDADETATSPVTVTFNSGNWNVPQAVTVNGVDEDIADGTQIFNISVSVAGSSTAAEFTALPSQNVLTSVTNEDVAAYVVTPGSLTVTEDGGTDTYSVVLTSEPVGTVNISVTSFDTGEFVLTDADETATSPVTLNFTNANWNIAQTVDVVGSAEAIDDGDQTVTVRFQVAGSSTDSTGYPALPLQDFTETIQDNDTAAMTVTESGGSTSLAEDGGTDTFTVILQSEPVGTVVVTVTSQDTSEANLTYAGQTNTNPITISFTSANWNVLQTVTVVGTNEDIEDGNQTFDIDVAVTSSPSDSTTYGNTGLVPAQTVSTTVIDNDSVGVTNVEIGGGGTLVNEDGGTDTFTVQLNSEPTGDVKIDVSRLDATEIDLNSLGTGLVTLSFDAANWNTPQTITVIGVPEDVADGTQNIDVTVRVNAGTTTDPLYAALSAFPQTVTVTVPDNDSVGVTVMVPFCETVIPENGGTATFTVLLNSEPLGTVDIQVVSSDIGEMLLTDNNETRLSPVTLNFTSGNWNTLQTVTVEGVTDATVDGDVPVTAVVHVSAGSTDSTGYVGLVDQTVAVTVQDSDADGFTIAQSNCATALLEGGAVDTITVRPSSEPTTTVEVTVTSTDATELTLMGIPTPEVVVLNFDNTNWRTPQSVTLVGEDDEIDDGDQTFDIEFEVTGGNDAGYLGLGIQTFSVTVVDIHTASIFRTPTGLTVAENGAAGSFNVSLATRPEPAQTVVLTATSSDTSEALVSDNADETTPATSITLTFNNADAFTAQTVNVTPIDELNADGNQPVTVTLAINTGATTDAVYDTVGNRTVAVTVQDDDTAGLTIVESGGSILLAEAAGVDTFTVRLTSEPLAPVNLTVTSTDTTEVLLTDANETLQTSVTLPFTNADWTTPQTVTITGQDEDIADGTQVFNVTVAVAGGSSAEYLSVPTQNVSTSVTDDNTAGFTIVESSGSTVITEDGALDDTFTVVLTSEPVGVVDITVTGVDSGETLVQGGDSPGTPVAAITLTFTNADWTTPQTVTVVGANEDVDDGNQSATVSVAVDPGSTDTTGYTALATQNVSVTVQDNDSAGVTVTESGGTTLTETGTDTFTVRLTSEPVGTVTIAVISTDVSEAVLTDANETQTSPITLTFNNVNWTTPQTVTVEGVNEFIIDGDQTFNVTVAVAAAPLDSPAYTSLTTQNVSVTVQDDDVAGVTITASGGSTVLSENGGTDTFTVVLNTVPNNPVVITVTSSDTSEAVLTDADETGVSPVTLTFTFGDWSTPQTVTVVGVDEFVIDGNASVNLTVAVDGATTDTTGYQAVGAQMVAATIQDDDFAGMTITETGGSTVLSENGGTDTFKVELTSVPDGDVVVLVASSDLSEATVSPATLTFDAIDWMTPQTVTVTGVNDDIADGSQGFNITVSIDAGATLDTTGYDIVTAQNVATTVQDDDTAGFTITESSGTTVLSENAGMDTFDLRLDSEPNGTVDITVTSADTGEAVMSDIDETQTSPVTVSFDNVNWSTPQTVTVDGVDDAIADGDQIFNLTVAVSGGSTDSTGFTALPPQNIAVTVQDDDAPGITILETAGSTIVSENAATDTFDIVLASQPDGNVVITVTSSNSAKALLSDADETLLGSVLLTFDNLDWNTPQTVTMTGVNNDIVDGSAAVNLVMAVSGATTDTTGFAGLGNQTVSATVTDDDTAGITVIESGGSTALLENGGIETLTVNLSSEPDGTVVITLTSDDTTEAVLSDADESQLATVSLTFDNLNWSTPQTVTVLGEDDAAPDGAQLVNITVAIDVGNTLDTTGYLGVAPQVVIATVFSDE